MTSATPGGVTSPPGSAPPGSAPPGRRLDVGEAFREGWAVFRRTPWVFTGFTLLYLGIGVALGLLDSSQSPPATVGTAPTPTAAGVLCQLLSFGVGIWGLTGTVRGAWMGLEGKRPMIADLLRWDGRSFVRVLLTWLLLSLILTLVIVPLAVLAIIAIDQQVDLNFPLSGPPFLRSITPALPSLLLLFGSLLAILAFATYLQVNQHFLVQLATLRRTGPLRTLALGRRVVDRQWWAVLGLIALETLLLLAGALACAVGLLVALPLVTCISTAAYRQLFADAGPPGAAALP